MSILGFHMAINKEIMSHCWREEEQRGEDSRGKKKKEKEMQQGRKGK